MASYKKASKKIAKQKKKRKHERKTNVKHHKAPTSFPLWLQKKESICRKLFYFPSEVYFQVYFRDKKYVLVCILIVLFNDLCSYERSKYIYS